MNKKGQIVFPVKKNEPRYLFNYNSLNVKTILHRYSEKLTIRKHQITLINNILERHNICAKGLEKFNSLPLCRQNI